MLTASKQYKRVQLSACLKRKQVLKADSRNTLYNRRVYGRRTDEILTDLPTARRCYVAGMPIAWPLTSFRSNRGYLSFFTLRSNDWIDLTYA